ncbi:unnamed protein product [Amaranthus hypochondriacus]
MMAYNYNEIAVATQDPFKGAGNRKLRPLVPRPYLSPLPENTPSLTPFNFEDNTNKETNTHQVMVSSRWNPTPEQLRALEELYRRGTRTPTAEQIQHITAQLRRYGKIEGKNVFYWFQNHKARERQKRRRQLQLPTTNTAGNRIGYEAEQKSCKWAPSTNKESDPPIQITEAESGGVTKADQTSSTSDAWIQFHHHNTHHPLPPQFQHNHTINNNNNNNNNIINIPSPGTNLLFAGERNVTWHHNNLMVQPYSSSCSCCSYPNSNSNSNSPLPSLPFSLSSKFNPSSILSQIHRKPDKPVNNNRDNVIHGGVGSVTPPSSPTLQLFPVLLKSHHHHDHHDNHMEIMITKEDEERENDASLLLLKNSCNNEKATSNNNNNVNNPFPYYQFL